MHVIPHDVMCVHTSGCWWQGPPSSAHSLCRPGGHSPADEGPSVATRADGICSSFKHGRRECGVRRGCGGRSPTRHTRHDALDVPVSNGHAPANVDAPEPTDRGTYLIYVLCVLMCMYCSVLLVLLESYLADLEQLYVKFKKKK